MLVFKELVVQDGTWRNCSIVVNNDDTVITTRIYYTLASFTLVNT